MLKSRRTQTVVVLVGCLGLSAIAVAQPPGGGGGMPVVVAPIVERDVPESMRLVGTVRANRSSVVAAEVSGLIASFEVQEGQFLEAGDLIAKIDPTTAQLKLDEAQAVLEARRAALSELEAGEREEDLRRLRAAAAEAKALFDKWKFERDRIEELYQLNQANPKEKHDTEMEYIAAERRYAQAQATLEKAENGARQEDIAEARFEVAAQEAIVRRLERDLSKTAIRAPFAGFVVARRTEVGEWINAGGPVCDMIDLEVVKIRVDVPEKAIAYARTGASATVDIEALGEMREAEVSRVIPRATEAARTFPVEIDLPNEDHRLLAGMFVWTHVPAGPPGKRLMVNKDALVVRGAAKQIFVVQPGREGGKMAMPTPVTTGMELGGQIEVRGPGLQPGAEVVVRANERLYGPTPVSTTMLDEEQRGPGSEPEAAMRSKPK